ncbi:MAG: hypothetical protein LBS32_07595 [Clostridiales Family XIII bacterium]|jgi:hypothetical protein|nr:hypothetical protein [Clostridiales Family XIII bacterium]
MKTWHGVRTRHYDSGDAMPRMIGTAEAEDRPKTEFRELPMYDEYTDWFGTRKEAERFFRNALEA